MNLNVPINMSEFLCLVRWLSSNLTHTVSEYSCVLTQSCRLFLHAPAFVKLHFLSIILTLQ
jgi:hypothetical protein